MSLTRVFELQKMVKDAIKDVEGVERAGRPLTR